MDKEQWVKLFKSIGMDEPKMRAWHLEFEKQFPDEHQKFMEWLNIPSKEIEDIRQKCQQAGS